MNHSAPTVIADCSTKRLGGLRVGPRWRRVLALAFFALALTCQGCSEPGTEGATPAGTPTARPATVVLIIVDTLRADHLGLHGYERPTSPQLDDWAAAGRVFDDAWASSSWTLPAFGSIYTGHLAARHGAGLIPRNRGPNPKPLGLDRKARTLAEILASNGYETGAVMNNPFLAREFGVAAGFGTYDYVAGNNRNIRRADEVVTRSLEWLDRHTEKPAFLVVHFFDPHMDYDPPPSVRGTFTGKISSELSLPIEHMEWLRRHGKELSEADRAFVNAAYDEELLAVDHATGRLLGGLQERGVLETGIVVYTSDHGEEIFDHDGFEHGHAMWQELLHVPLIFWGKGIEAGREAGPVSHVDIMPTLLEALGVAPEPDLEGISLVGNLRRGEEIAKRRLYAEGNLYGTQRIAVLDWPHKLIFEQDSPLASRLYNLVDDAAESRNLAGRQMDYTKGLLREALARIEKAAGKRSRQDEVKLEDETRERLKSLGYIQ